MSERESVVAVEGPQGLSRDQSAAWAVCQLSTLVANDNLVWNRDPKRSRDIAGRQCTALDIVRSNIANRCNAGPCASMRSYGMVSPRDAW